jgi:predicted phosphoribosyltransferase
MEARLADRTSAGRLLAAELVSLGPAARVLALPRGGVPVAYQVAATLGAPLDVVASARVAAPGRPELAIGAVAPGAVVLDRGLIAEFDLSRRYVELAVAEATAEVERATRDYRAVCPERAIRDTDVLLVDDGLATGASALAAISSVRRSRLRSIAFATPVASPAGRQSVTAAADRFICLLEPDPFEAVSTWYQSFAPVDRAEVVRLLRLQLSSS